MRGRVEARLRARTELASLALFQSLLCWGLFLQVGIHLPDDLEFRARRAAFAAELDIVPPYLEHPPLLGVVDIPEMGPLGVSVAGAVLLASLLGAALGWRVRWLVAVSLIAYFVYFSQILELGTVRRKANLVPFVLLILLAAPDLQRCRPGVAWRGLVRRAADSTPAWPLVLVKVTLASAYLAAGLSKLRNTGVSWARGDVLQAHLLECGLEADLPLAMWLAAHPALVQLASLATLALELGFWTVLFAPRLGPLYAALGIGFHLGTGVFMGIDYLRYWGPVYLVFFDVALLREATQMRAGLRVRHTAASP